MRGPVFSTLILASFLSFTSAQESPSVETDSVEVPEIVQDDDTLVDATDSIIEVDTLIASPDTVASDAAWDEAIAADTASVTTSDSAVFPPDTTMSATDSLSPVDTSKSAASADTIPDDTTVSVVEPEGSEPDEAEPVEESEQERRDRIVRETTVHTIDELKGRYRSPKRALFMSLVVPGLGQAYVGGHTSNYVRSAMYVAAEGALAFFWHRYTVVLHDRQVDRYRNFADSNYIRQDYEDFVFDFYGRETAREDFPKANPHRSRFCLSVYPPGQQNLREGCDDIYGPNYEDYRSTVQDRSLSSAQRAQEREAFHDDHTFYELVGKYNEFLAGWTDVNASELQGDTAVTLIPGKTADLRQEYREMRARATDLSRMQTWFVGGLVLNHLVSAVDAAIAAQAHNRSLYQTEVRWYHRMRLRSMLALVDGSPSPSLLAQVSF